MTDRPLLLAIDLGTSGAKVGLVSLDGDIVEWGFEPTRLILVPGGGAEQDPAQWWQAITKACRRLATPHSRTADIVGVACTGQWSGTVAVDATGAHLHNALIWMDARGRELVQRRVGGALRVQGYDVRKIARWIRLTGGAPERSGKDPVAHILWLTHHRPDLCAASAAFLEPKDYLNARLTGRLAAGFDSIALHWVTDNRAVDRVRYDRRLVAMTGIDAAKLPTLRSPTDVLGPLLPAAAAELGLPAGLPVVMGAPDMHTACLGAGAAANYDAHLYVGTSSWLICHVPFKKTDIAHNMASLPAALPGRWMLANEQETAGACLHHLAHGLGIYPDGLGADSDPTEVYRAFDRIAERVRPGNSGVIFAPWLYGERTPVEDATVRGALLNVSLDTCRDDIVRAVFEGVALNARWLLRHVERFIGREISSIRMVGGGAQSRVWCQIHADVLGRTIHRVADPAQVNLRGAALLGFLSLGLIGVDDLNRGATIVDSFHPRPDAAAVYDRIFPELVRFYRATRAIHARLNVDRPSAQSRVTPS